MHSTLLADQHLDQRRTITLILVASLIQATAASAQSGRAEATGCVPYGEVERIVETPARVMYATLEAERTNSPTLAIYLGTLLQEIALVFIAPDSAIPLQTFSFTLRLHRDGRLSDAHLSEAYVPSALAEAAIRAIDSVSRAGGIGPVPFDVDEDPLFLRMVFRLGERTSDISVPFYEMRYPAYFEYETDKPALAVPGNPAPRYPAALRDQHIEGEVLVQFVVDTMGRADMRTLRLLGPRRVYKEFVKSVFDVLPKMRFSSAERRGCKVKQLVQLPFAFKINW